MSRLACGGSVALRGSLRGGGFSGANEKTTQTNLCRSEQVEEHETPPRRRRDDCQRTNLSNRISAKPRLKLGRISVAS